MIKSVSSRSPSTTARLTQDGGKAMAAQLKSLDGQITKAKAAVSKQAKMMTVARFTPEGYKAALHTLHSLQKAEKKLEGERSKLVDLMTRA